MCPLVMVQHRNAASHITLGGEVCIEPQRPTTQAAWAKQKELYGDMDKDGHTAWMCFVSRRKCKEVAGNNLFGDIPPLATPADEVKRKRILLTGNPRSVIHLFYWSET